MTLTTTSRSGANVDDVAAAQARHLVCHRRLVGDGGTGSGRGPPPCVIVRSKRFGPWPPASSGAELAATRIGLIICGTKRPNIGNLPKRLKTHP
jgi:hypothetical protein